MGNEKICENESEEITVSVVMPVYNGEKYLNQAIESVLLQRKEISSIELLIVDDASTDSTPEIIKKYQKENPEIRYLRNKTNMGAARSRNYGVEEAKGRWIAFLDADDWWEEGKLIKQLEMLKKKKASLCTTARELVNEEGDSLRCIIPVKEEISYKMMLRQNWINCSSVLVLRHIMREFPMLHEDAHEDYITWMKIIQTYGSACGVNEVLLKYRLTGKGKSGSKWKSAQMTWSSYRYLGFGIIKSLYCFSICCTESGNIERLNSIEGCEKDRRKITNISINNESG